MDQIARSTKQIGATIRRARRQMNLSQEQLGEKVHLRQATISRLEAGEPATRLTTLMSALSALGLEIVIRERTTSEPTDIEDIF